MRAFVTFMHSTTGRVLRIVVGIALIALDLLVIQGIWGILLAVIRLCHNCLHSSSRSSQRFLSMKRFTMLLS
jgi:hypothetical protein